VQYGPAAESAFASAHDGDSLTADAPLPDCFAMPAILASRMCL
jgi:hypothetical protein